MAAFQVNAGAFQRRRRPTMSVNIASVGNMCMDIALPISRYPIEAGAHQRLVNGAQLDLGGSLNLLIAASRLGARTSAISHLPPDDDILSELLLRWASREGIETGGLVRHERASVPTCAALVDEDGRHTFLASNEEAVESVRDEPTATMRQIVRNADVVVVDGYALCSDACLVHACIQEARVVWLDPQGRGAKSDMDEVIARADGVCVTVEEGERMTRTRGKEAVMEALAGMGKCAVVKDGAKGCDAVCDGMHVHADGFDIGSEFCDSVGAGDAFLGAFLTARARGRPLSQCCLLANAMGAATCLHRGAGLSGVGTRDEVAMLLQRVGQRSLLDDLPPSS